MNSVLLNPQAREHFVVQENHCEQIRHLRNHVDQLHNPRLKHGRVAVCVNQRGDWLQSMLEPSDLLHVSESLAFEEDVYVSMSRFRHGASRRVDALHSIPHCFIDLDHYSLPNLASLSAEKLVQHVELLLSEEGVPLPTLAVFSGRGVQLVWRLKEPLPQSALPKWNSVQSQLQLKLARLGADPMAIDVCRVFRLAGTINSKSGAVSRLIHLNGVSVDFDHLSDRVLPHTREEWKAISDEFEESAGKGRPLMLPPMVARQMAQRLHLARQHDFRTLLKLRFFPALLPPGQRDLWLFWYAVAESWLDPHRMLSNMTIRANELAGWSAPETRSRLSAVQRRAQMDLALRTQKARYRVKNETLVRRLEITEDEMQRGQFQALLTPDLKRERKLKLQRLREEAKRRAEGCLTRSEYETNSLSKLQPWRKLGMSRATYYREINPKAE